MTDTVRTGLVPARAGLAGAAIWIILAAALVAACLLSFGIGRFGVPVDHTVGILFSHILPVEPTWTDVEARVVNLLRGPRILIAVFAGAALAISGASLQAVFSNPLVDPQIIGVSSGAAAGGVFAILVFGDPTTTVMFSFLGGLLAIGIVYGLSTIAGRSSVLSLVLGGVVISAFFLALVGVVKYVADPEDKLPTIVFWLMGSFAVSTWERFWMMFVPVVVSGAGLLLLRYRINILSLGDEEAASLRINVTGTRWLVLICVALCTSATVAVSGVIGWVGLIIPYIARMLVGPNNTVVLPASALLGGIYLLMVDNVARTATAGEMPIGMITALIGTPIFAYLFWRSQRVKNG